MTLDDIEVGMWVIYQPHPGAPVEDGEVTEIRGDLVMVRYRIGATAKATYPGDLRPGATPLP
jgi:hypothetical protein